MVVDPSCNITHFNARAQQLTGHRPESVLGKSCEENLRLSLCGARCPLREALQTGISGRHGTVVLQLHDRLPTPVEITATPVCDEAGEIVGAIGILQNITGDDGQFRVYGERIFVSRTPAMRKVFDALPLLASSEAPLLIRGEVGTGRAALARMVHTLGRSGPGAPLTRIPCGHYRGGDLAATITGPGGDAVARSVVLEELDLAPPELQRELLAWLEEEPAHPLPRLLSTVSGPPESLLPGGHLQRDLLFRLGVLDVELPNLSDRRADIPLLAEVFIEELNRLNGHEIEGFTADALQHLVDADFPGNVSQLKEIISSAHAKIDQGRIGLADLESAGLPTASMPRDSLSLHARKANFEVDAIRSALARTGGNLSQAARLLKLHRTTLWRKMRRLGIHQG